MRTVLAKLLMLFALLCGQTVTLNQISSVTYKQTAAGACPYAAPSLGEYAEQQMRALGEG